jgi:type II secretory pathway predicted ATPase ExeA
VKTLIQQLLFGSSLPFQATPDSRYFFDFASFEFARQTVTRSIIRSEGPCVVLGGAGLGKSLLATIVAEQLRERMDIVTLQSARLNGRRALLQSILFELKLPYREMSEGELRLSILDRLEPTPDRAPDGVLIIVDEGQSLHWKLLDELRLISNFARNHQPRVKLVVLGDMRLEETLAMPQLESFNQRLAARCYLQPMNRAETSGFVQHQLRVAGVDPIQVITQDALQAIFSASHGNPRLVNQLMSHALWLANENSQLPISAALIGDAWSELQQLPSPWASQAESSTTVSAIEFGELSAGFDEPEIELSVPAIPADVSSRIRDVASATAFSEEEFDRAGQVLQFENPAASIVAAEHTIQAVPSSTKSPTISVKVTVSNSQTEAGSAAEMTPSEQISFSAEDDSEQYDNCGEFFAAFKPTTSGKYLQDLESSGINDAWRITSDPNAPATYEVQLEPNLLQFDRSTETKTHWFALTENANIGEKKDFEEDRINVLIAEQQQYDTMGIWENDPPLQSQLHDQADPVNTLPSTSSNPFANTTSSLGSIFGNDFEDEIEVPGVASPKQADTVSAIRPSHSGSAENVFAVQPQLVSTSEPDWELPDISDPHEASLASLEYITRLQQYADALTKTTQSSLSADNASHDPSPSGPGMPIAEFWTIDVGTSDSKTSPGQGANGRLEESIEELVAQLNFSAFTVEPFSIEQIPLTVENSRPADSIRSGKNSEIYMMHRPLEAEKSVLSAVNEVDDDRDMLIVEEDVPVSSRSVENSGKGVPTKPTPYTQLFARLRK